MENFSPVVERRQMVAISLATLRTLTNYLSKEGFAGGLECLTTASYAAQELCSTTIIFSNVISADTFY